LRAKQKCIEAYDDYVIIYNKLISLDSIDKTKDRALMSRGEYINTHCTDDEIVRCNDSRAKKCTPLEEIPEP
jgi:hypothetical protein